MTTVREQVAALFRETLFRDPDARSLAQYVMRVRSERLSVDGCRDELRATREHGQVVEPLVAEILRVYETVLLREPSQDEIRQSFDHVRSQLVTHETVSRALEEGSILRHLGIRPLKLVLDITTQCNIRCIMCHFSEERFSKRKRIDISVDDFSEIAHQVFPFCERMSFSCGTEPLLHKEFEELLQITKNQGVPWVHMNTNGLLLDEDRIERIVEAGIDGIAISIDGATKPTYERIRRLGNFDRLIANIRALAREKERRGVYHPVVTFNYVLMRSNIDELPALVRLAHELGVEGIAAMHLTQFETVDVSGESLEPHKELCNRRLDEAKVIAEELGIPVAFPERFHEEPESEKTLKPETPRGFQIPEDGVEESPSRCPFPWHFVGIDPYGNVMPCGWWFTERAMGNIGEESFDSIWNSPRYNELRNEHNEGCLRETCRTCPAAGMGSVDHPNAFEVKELGDSPG